jgi:hypothetical protein
MGPMTGRRAGYCADSDVPGFANPVPGRGYGRGRGRGQYQPWGRRGGGGRGWRNRFYATGRPGWARDAYAYGPGWEVPPPQTREQELEGLRQEAEWLKGQLDAISQRIEDIEE